MWVVEVASAFSAGEFFGIDTVDLRGEVLLALTGELDTAAAPILHEHLFDIASRAKVIFIDARDLSFIDSTGLSVLVKAQKWLKEMGGSLVVRNANAQVRRLFDVTGLSSRLLA